MINPDDTQVKIEQAEISCLPVRDLLTEFPLNTVLVLEKKSNCIKINKYVAYSPKGATSVN